MKKITLLIPLFLMVFLYACATPYQQAGFRGGYSQTRLDENVFKVIFNGNSSTSEERVFDFALLRCAELTLKNGYQYFVIVDEKKYKRTHTHTTPVRATTENSARANRRGGITRSQTTVVTGGDTYTSVSPGLSNLIICFKNKPKEGFSYKASFIRQNIKDKYKLEV